MLAVVVLSEIVLAVVRPAAVAAVVVPMIRLPAVVVAFPRTMADVLLVIERKSVTWSAPPWTLVAPSNVAPVPTMVSRPAPVLVSTWSKEAAEATRLPVMVVLPAPPMARVRAPVLSALFQTFAANVSRPPISLVMVLFPLLDSRVHSWKAMP